MHADSSVDFLQAIWIVSLTQFTHVEYGEYKYPSYAVGIGWVIALLSFIMIPMGMASTLFNTRDRSASLVQVYIFIYVYSLASAKC